ncbi:MAG: glycosyltransferase family 2 protein [Candidatus Fermentibacteraceae bacterium]|nr:glycosyltransferase family 2 protein [Candidatus Fermentibacteraceae bacterium]MBN2609082.1 glycosyltransferase family 2 protein [Candidatus Fermentibacteraceae bacterium]
MVVPVYNSSQSLRELTLRVREVMNGLGRPFEVLLVDDGSSDDSWNVIAALKTELAGLRGIRLSRNYGQHNALLCGIRAARMPLTVTIDDDLQIPPEEIPVLLDRLKDDVDVVYGTPARERHNFWRKAASRMTKAVLRSAMGARTASRVSAFRVFRTRLREAFSNYGGAFVSMDVLLSWGTTRFDSVDVRHEPRKYGRSQYTVRRLVFHALNMMTGFSTLPLEIASMAGFVFTLFGVAVLLFVVSRYLIEGGSVPGFPFLASIIAIFSGVQLFSLGIIGEYLARMHFRVMDKPPYAVRSETGTPSGHEPGRV